MLKVLIVDDVHPCLLERLTSKFELDYQPEIRPEEIGEIIGGYEGLVIRSKVRFDKKLRERAVRLRFIARAGSGLDNLDADAIAGLQVIHAAEGNRQAVAEHALGMMLSVVRNLPRANAEVRQGVWRREANRGRELSEMNIGIIGYGNVGSALAKLLAPFGCTLWVYDKYKKGFGSDWLRECSLEDLMAHADLISLHIPLTEETRAWVDAAWLKLLGKPAVLVNTARGEIVQIEAVVRALEEGKLLGAALDVLPNEKPQRWSAEEKQMYERLGSFDSVALSPHIAGWTVESYRKISEVLAEKMWDWVA